MANKNRVGHSNKKAPAHDAKEKRAAKREAKREARAAQHGKHANRAAATS